MAFPAVGLCQQPSVPIAVARTVVGVGGTVARRRRGGGGQGQGQEEGGEGGRCRGALAAQQLIVICTALQGCSGGMHWCTAVAKA